MVQRILLLVLLGTALICGGGCAGFVPFTQAHFQQFEVDLDQVQFYISQRVELSRDNSAETRQVLDSGHRLQVSKEQRVEKILIVPSTAGVLQRIEGDTLFVQFEPPRGEAGRALPFRAMPLYPQETEPDTVVYILDASQLTYDGKTYALGYVEASEPVTRSDGAVYAEKGRRTDNVQYIQRLHFPILMINPVQKDSRMREEKRQLPGLRIGVP